MSYPDCCDDAITPAPVCCPAAFCARYGHSIEPGLRRDECCRVCDLPVDPDDDPHWDNDGLSAHPACCYCEPLRGMS